MLAVLVVVGLLTLQERAVLESAYIAYDPGLAADPETAVWSGAPRVTAHRDRLGGPVPGPPTEIRSRWTDDHLYLLFLCPYTSLHLKPDPVTSSETPRLWTWDVVEAFIGSDFERIGRYREFQVSPQGEWADFSIDRGDPANQEGARWNSGFQVSARIDASTGVWYAVMRIPFAALGGGPPAAGREYRLGLYRIAGATEPRTRYVWQPTGQPTFHVPEAFGTLLLR